MTHSAANQPTSASSSPVPEKTSFVVCPRRGKVWGSTKSSTSPVELSLDLLKPFFRKPLNQACLELGLSASAIKKACRAFGIPKWPCRALTARNSVRRAEMEEVSEGRCSANPSPAVVVKQEEALDLREDPSSPFTEADFSWDQESSVARSPDSEDSREEEASPLECYMQSIPSVAVPPTPTAAHVVYPEGMPGVDPSPRFGCQKSFDDSLFGMALKPSKSQVMSFMREVSDLTMEGEIFDDSIFVLNSSPSNSFNTM